MKWIQILRKGKYALLQSESDSQYVVASGYNPDDPEGQQWGHGSYFPLSRSKLYLLVGWHSTMNRKCTETELSLIA